MTNRMMRSTAVIAFGMLFSAVPAAANDFMHRNCMNSAESQYARCMDNADRRAERSTKAHSQMGRQMDERRCSTTRDGMVRQCERNLAQRERMRPNNANRR